MEVQITNYLITKYPGEVYNGIKQIDIDFYEGEAELFKEDLDKILDILESMVKKSRELVGEKPTTKPA